MNLPCTHTSQSRLTCTLRKAAVKTHFTNVAHTLYESASHARFMKPSSTAKARALIRRRSACSAPRTRRMSSSCVREIRSIAEISGSPSSCRHRRGGGRGRMSPPHEHQICSIVETSAGVLVPLQAPRMAIQTETRCGRYGMFTHTYNFKPGISQYTALAQAGR
eukprot:363727-Chlamydomonas_euryale.AAC.4